LLITTDVAQENNIFSIIFLIEEQELLLYGFISFLLDCTTEKWKLLITSVRRCQYFLPNSESSRRNGSFKC